ncbi:MAG: hypothetical protein ACC742_12210 [Thermoanaerobaculales bacterium]
MSRGDGRGPVLWLVLVLSGAIVGCGGFSNDEARRLVLTYNERVAKAFREADATLVDEVAGDKEARKITGLIGVRLDREVILDAELLGIDFENVRRESATVLVRTRESWRYQERRLGDGEPTGPPSDDRYEMLYELRRMDGRWVVDAIRFASPPQVGRPLPGWASGGSVPHGPGGGETQ